MTVKCVRCAVVLDQPTRYCERCEREVAALLASDERQRRSQTWRAKELVA